MKEEPIETICCRKCGHTIDHEQFERHEHIRHGNTAVKRFYDLVSLANLDSKRETVPNPKSEVYQNEKLLPFDPAVSIMNVIKFRISRGAGKDSIYKFKESMLSLWKSSRMQEFINSMEYDSLLVEVKK